MITPTVHLNGTSREALLKQTTDAAEAVWEAVEALMRMSPHGRDYYPQGDTAFTTARREHLARVGKVHAVYEELERLAVAISRPDQGAAA